MPTSQSMRRRTARLKSPQARAKRRATLDAKRIAGPAPAYPADAPSHGDRTDERPMSENAVLALLYRMGYKGRMTGHGLRSVGSTWANENGYPPDVIERQLAHVPGDATRSAYNRSQYIQARREMLEAFSKWLESCQIVQPL